jgi:ligand-binding SRPBCC domain-containing protein
MQTRGPYTLWHHTHEFEPDDGGAIIPIACATACRSVPLGTRSAQGSFAVISMRFSIFAKTDTGVS